MMQLPPLHASANILIVDHTPANVNELDEILAGRGYTLRPVANGKLALEAMAPEPPDLVLLDIDLPEMNAFDICQAMQTEPCLKEIPVIFLGASSEIQDKRKGFAFGGVDYLSIPFQKEEVQVRIENHLKNHHYGNSLLLVGVVNVLQSRPGLELFHLPSSKGEFMLINSPYPDALLFDLNSTEAKRIIQLLLKEDGICLMGIDFYRGVAVEYKKSKSPVSRSLDLDNLILSQKQPG